MVDKARYVTIVGSVGYAPTESTASREAAKLNEVLSGFKALL